MNVFLLHFTHFQRLILLNVPYQEIIRCSFFGTNTNPVDVKGNKLAGLVGDRGQWERERIYILNFSQCARGEDCNESVMRQRSKDLSLAGEGLRVEVIVSMDRAARRVGEGWMNLRH